MSDSDRGGRSPLPAALLIVGFCGACYYFATHYDIEGLDRVSVSAKSIAPGDDDFGPRPSSHFTSLSGGDDSPAFANRSLQPYAASTAASPETTVSTFRSDPLRPKSISSSLRIGSWALDGFGPTKFASPDVRRHLAAVIGTFDIIALQQVASLERDLLPRLAEEINRGGRRYEYLIGPTTGPRGRAEQLAFLFDTRTVQIDRRQSYTVDDPDDQFVHDPLVAWFRAAGESESAAWTFTVINVRIDLASAAGEVSALPYLVDSVRGDGRGEDDVILAGLFQADDAYLVPTLDLSGDAVHAAVQNQATDIFSRYQTANILIDSRATTEHLGRGGVYDFARDRRLTLPEAEAVTSHQPVFAEFTAHEGGAL